MRRLRLQERKQTTDPILVALGTCQDPDTSTVRDPSDNLTATRRRVGPGPLATRTPHEYTGVQIRRQLMRETEREKERRDASRVGYARP